MVEKIPWITGALSLVTCLAAIAWITSRAMTHRDQGILRAVAGEKLNAVVESVSRRLSNDSSHSTENRQSALANKQVETRYEKVLLILSLVALFFALVTIFSAFAVRKKSPAPISVQAYAPRAEIAFSIAENPASIARLEWHRQSGDEPARTIIEINKRLEEIELQYLAEVNDETNVLSYFFTSQPFTENSGRVQLVSSSARLHNTIKTLISNEGKYHVEAYLMNNEGSLGLSPAIDASTGVLIIDVPAASAESYLIVALYLKGENDDFDGSPIMRFRVFD